MQPFLSRRYWSEFVQEFSDLIDAMQKYLDFLVCQSARTAEHKKATSPVRSPDMDFGLRAIEGYFDILS